MKLAACPPVFQCKSFISYRAWYSGLVCDIIIVGDYVKGWWSRWSSVLWSARSAASCC